MFKLISRGQTRSHAFTKPETTRTAGRRAVSKRSGSAVPRRMISLLAALSVFGVSGTATAVPSITFSPLPTTLTVGDTFDVDWTFDSGNAGAGSPSLWNFDVGASLFGGTIVITGVSFFTGLNNGVAANSTQTSSVSATSASMQEVSLLSSATLDMVQPASFLMARISFEAVSVGTTTFGKVAIKTKFKTNLTDGGRITVPLLGGNSITVNAAVPEPESFLLVLTGLAGVAGLFRLRRMRRSGKKVVAQPGG